MVQMVGSRCRLRAYSGFLFLLLLNTLHRAYYLIDYSPPLFVYSHSFLLRCFFFTHVPRQGIASMDPTLEIICACAASAIAPLTTGALSIYCSILGPSVSSVRFLTLRSLGTLAYRLRSLRRDFPPSPNSTTLTPYLVCAVAQGGPSVAPGRGGEE